jgi:large subunit ribosomal protein L17
MRHHSKTKILHRDKRQRTALMRSLARSLVLHEGITTTEAKAKALRPFIERLVSISKANSLASRKSVSTRLGGAQDVVKKLHETIAPRYAKRAGGYTRVVRLGKIGKQAAIHARVEFVQ